MEQPLMVLPEEPNNTTTGNPLFPIFLKLEQMDVLLVGGGNVGLEKLRAMLGNSPATSVTVVADRILPELFAYAQDFPQVRIIQRTFELNDLNGRQLVMIATDNPELNRQIKEWANARGIFANVADVPELCDFYLSSIVQKGDLKIAISTNGRSPTIAKRLKETLHEAIPGEINEVLANMQAIRMRLKGDFASKVKILNHVTTTLVDESREEADLLSVFKPEKIEKINGLKWRRIATVAMSAFGLLLMANFLALCAPIYTWGAYLTQVDSNLWLFIGVGFIAQMIDGLLGMGYGVTTQIFLMGAGIPLPAVSSSIHTAEMFTSGASGYAHYKFGNINRRLFKVLLIPGILGAIAGAAMLSWLGDAYSAYIKPILAVYTLLLGIRILAKAFVRVTKKRRARNMGWLAGAGGFLDSFGGGGWGPLVTSTLIAKGKTPQYVIGTVSLTEFFVTFASAITFFSLIGIAHWMIIFGLILGGVAAAPISARLAGKIPVRYMMFGVGVMVIFWSMRILWRAFF